MVIIIIITLFFHILLFQNVDNTCTGTHHPPHPYPPNQAHPGYSPADPQYHPVNQQLPPLGPQYTPSDYNQHPLPCDPANMQCPPIDPNYSRPPPL